MSVTRNPNLDTVRAREAPEATEFWRLNLGRSAINLGLPRDHDWWTGLPPCQCPGFGVDGKLRSLAMPNLATCTRAQVRDYFNNTWTLTELLFSSLLGDEPFFRPPYHGLRHPLIFYYVHPAVLYVNKLRMAKLAGAINPEFESLFETGVDEMSWDDMSKNEIEWPGIDAARAYRKLVYCLVLSIIDNHPDLGPAHAPILQEHPLWALFMGFEHERIHLETSSVLIRELPVHLVSRPPQWPAIAPHSEGEVAYPPRAGRDYPENQFRQVSAQTVNYGKDREFPTYGWDNEYGFRSVQLAEFAAGSLLVSNGEFWQFVASGGYLDRENWSEIGFQWRSFRNVKYPTFWVPCGPDGAHEFNLRTCFEVIPMQWDFPVVVNFHEARAFCQWKSRQEGRTFRLLTEAEHQALRGADTLEIGSAPSSNLNLQLGSESRVDGDFRDRKEGSGFSFVFGNVWQWCEDHFNPLPGSRIHPFYDDFSTPCYDGEHQMIMGGSFVSTGDEATVHARFHFRPHFHQHAGFRLVSTCDGGDGAVVHIGDRAATATASPAPRAQA